jgi:hypothetical protein
MHKLRARLGSSARLLEPIPPRPRDVRTHVPNATLTLFLAVATEHGDSAAEVRRYDVSTGTRDRVDRGRNYLCRPPLREQETRECGLVRHAL